MKTSYTYTVLRYLHDMVTGEFLNVGLVVYAPEAGVLKHKLRTTIGRIKNVFPDLDRYSFAEAQRSVARGLRRIEKAENLKGLTLEPHDARSIACKALPNDDSALQWSPVGSGLTANVNETFDRLYERFVARYDTKTPHRRSDEEVWRPVAERLVTRKLPISLMEKTIVGATDSVTFKHAWKNGVWHAYEPVSLDLADAENIKDKARRIFGNLVATHDPHAIGNSEQNLKLKLFVGAPDNPRLRPAYESALKILRTAPFNTEVFEEQQVDELVNRIEDDARSTGFYTLTDPG